MADSAKRPCPICRGLLAHEADCLLILARDARENTERHVHALDEARKAEQAIYRECRAQGASPYLIAEVTGLSRAAVELNIMQPDERRARQQGKAATR